MWQLLQIPKGQETLEHVLLIKGFKLHPTNATPMTRWPPGNSRSFPGAADLSCTFPGIQGAEEAGQSLAQQSADDRPLPTSLSLSIPRTLRLLQPQKTGGTSRVWAGNEEFTAGITKKVTTAADTPSVPEARVKDPDESL